MRVVYRALYRSAAPLAVSFLFAASTTIGLSTTMMAYAEASASSPSPPLTGLKNLGNTCYMNSQLQCAFHIPFVRTLILEEQRQPQKEETRSEDGAVEDEDPVHDDDDDNDVSSSLPAESPGLWALRVVFSEMNKVGQMRPATGVVSPVVLTRTLGIPVMEQQDSQEFWKLLLPALRLPQLTDLYQGSFEDYLVAQDGSGRGSTREEVFLDLSLNVPSSSSSSVRDSLVAAFGEAELLKVSEGNGWRPEKGADKVDALKGSRLRAQGLPCILQLHLKRFTYDWNRDVMEKSNVPLSFSDELDLSSLCDDIDIDREQGDAAYKDDLIYDLQGVVIHAGQFDVGHYYAYVRPDLGENRWYRINDDMIDEVSFEQVLTDAIGGKVQRPATNGTAAKGKKGLLQKMLGVFRGTQDGSYGFGGSTSNAYVLQYVKRSQRDRLYKDL